MIYLTRAEKQDILLKYLLTTLSPVTVGAAIRFLNYKHSIKGNILDKRI